VGVNQSINQSINQPTCLFTRGKNLSWFNVKITRIGEMTASSTSRLLIFINFRN